MKLSVVVPCYNEAKNIPALLENFSKIIRRDDIEIIIVDNVSTDNSAEVIKRLIPQFPFVRSMVCHERGYGAAILAGLKEAAGDFIGWTHGDLQTSADDVLRALEILEQSSSYERVYIKGYRRGRPFFDALFSYGMGLFDSLLLKTWLVEINAQPNIFHRSFFSHWEEAPSDFSLDLYAYYLAKKTNLSIIRIPVEFKKRFHGVSSWNTGLWSRYRLIKRTILFSFKLRMRMFKMLR